MTPQTSAPRRERDPIRSLVRVLGQLLDHGDRPVGVRELARSLDLSPSTVQRTLESARNASAVTPTKDGKWRVGWEMYRLASLLQSHDPFIGCQDDLDQLAADLDETVVLTVLDQDRGERMFVASSESARAVRFVPQLYSWLPALAGATGLAIVATLSPADRKHIHAAMPAERQPRRVRRLGDFEQVCAEIRDQGYAVSRDEVDLGACSVAVPVDQRAGIPCALGLIAPEQRFEDPSDQTVRKVRRAAASVAARLGVEST